ncbi:MAG: transposase [Coprobacillus sp.]|nr:transposase [Coprobacillus sp.]
MIGKNLYLDESLILKEEQYDGFYALVTNLDDNDEEIVNINHNRWKMEESFRIMKTEFKSRPVYVQKESHIKAHFLTCYLAFLFYRILEQKLNVDGYHFTTHEIIDSLREMKLMKAGDLGYYHGYTASTLTNRLCQIFSLPLNKEGYRNITLKRIISFSKKEE